MTKRTGRRPGRPKRQKASEKALADIDLASIDPLVVLRTIAGDVSAPASARVSACKALLSVQQHGEGDQLTIDQDPVARRALRILKGGKS